MGEVQYSTAPQSCVPQAGGKRASGVQVARRCERAAEAGAQGAGKLLGVLVSV